MPTYVLGTHTSHNGSACLIKDGKIAVAIEKERITRIKHDGGNDNAAIQYCLSAEGIKLSDVALVVQNANFEMFEHKRAQGTGRIADDARRVITISHHLAHMFSAIGTAPFADMTALVIDGCGNCYADCVDRNGATIPEHPATRDLEQLFFEKDSYYEYRGNRWRTVFKDFSPGARRQGYPMQPGITMHSIGGLYNAVSIYVFQGLDDPGKLMGLAPYGRPGIFSDDIFTLKDGRVFLNYEWMRKFNRPALDYRDLKGNFQYYADLAFWTQREVERALLYMVNSRYEMCPSENLVYSGGVALNAVANRLILTKTKFKNVYFQPAAGDNGLAIGCAFYGWLEVLRGGQCRHNGSTCFGRTYSDKEISEALAKEGHRVKFHREPDIVSTAANLIARGKIIGWFQGRSEFGPRALGQRSILALPDSAETKDFINAKIKFREDFRPFAPSVIAEDAHLYFDHSQDSPYMILIAPVRPEWKSRMPAVVHRDESARLQTVHRDISPRYHRLLLAIKQRRGMSVLLNTSFNRRGKPIVETPADALQLLLETGLDALVLEDWLVTKSPEASAKAESSLDPASLFQNACQYAATDPERPDLSPGLLRLVVTGVDQSLAIDFSSDTPRIVKGEQPLHVDHTVCFTTASLREAVHDPVRLRQLHETGSIQIPGLLPKQHPQAAKDLLAKLTYLLRTIKRQMR